MKLGNDTMQKATVARLWEPNSGACVLAVTKDRNVAGRGSALFGMEVIDVLSVKGDSAKVSPRAQQDVPAQDIEWLPAHCIAVVEDGSNPKLVGQVKRWLSNASSEAVPIVSIETEAGRLTELLLQRYRTAMARNAQLGRDLGTLREVHEETQNAYNALRTFVYSHGLQAPQLAFSNSPNPAYDSTPGSARIIEQELPLPTREIAAIGVFVGQVPDQRAQGSVTFQLVAVENQKILAHWKLPLTRLRNGWLTLATDQVGFFSRRTAHLVITIEETAGFAGPEFAVGGPQPRADKRARVNGIEMECSLAVRIWKALPGTLTQATHAMGFIVHQTSVEGLAGSDNQATEGATGKPRHRRLKAANSAREILLDLSAKIELIDVFGIQHPDQGAMLQVNSQDNHIVVHPRPDGPSVARIRDVCPSATQTITADVVVAHELASPIEFALAIANGKRFDEVGISDADPNSGWVRVGPKDVATLRIDLPAPLEEPYDLFLCTRLPEGSRMDFGWAHFRRVTFSGPFGI